MLTFLSKLCYHHFRSDDFFFFFFIEEITKRRLKQKSTIKLFWQVAMLGKNIIYMKKSSCKVSLTKSTILEFDLLWSFPLHFGLQPCISLHLAVVCIIISFEGDIWWWWLLLSVCLPAYID